MNLEKVLSIFCKVLCLCEWRREKKMPFLMKSASVFLLATLKEENRMGCNICPKKGANEHYLPTRASSWGSSSILYLFK